MNNQLAFYENHFEKKTKPHCFLGSFSRHLMPESLTLLPLMKTQQTLF